MYLCIHSGFENEFHKGEGHGTSLLPKHNGRLATLVAVAMAPAFPKEARTNERTEPETLLLRAKKWSSSEAEGEGASERGPSSRVSNNSLRAFGEHLR